MPFRTPTLPVTPAAAALLVAALTSSPRELLAATEDRLHQQYRLPRLPAGQALLTRLREAGVPAVLSGSGPTVLALCRDGVEVGGCPRPGREAATSPMTWLLTSQEPPASRLPARNILRRDTLLRLTVAAGGMLTISNRLRPGLHLPPDLPGAGFFRSTPGSTLTGSVSRRRGVYLPLPGIRPERSPT